MIGGSPLSILEEVALPTTSGGENVKEMGDILDNTRSIASGCLRVMEVDGVRLEAGEDLLSLDQGRTRVGTVHT